MTLGKASVGIVYPGQNTYNIGFNGSDVAQFSACDLMDLLERWIEFCVENGVHTNSVDFVERAEVNQSLSGRRL